MLRRTFHYRCSLMYAAVYDINYVADSVVLEERTLMEKEWAPRYPVNKQYMDDISFVLPKAGVCAKAPI